MIGTTFRERDATLIEIESLAGRGDPVAEKKFVYGDVALVKEVPEILFGDESECGLGEGGFLAVQEVDEVANFQVFVIQGKIFSEFAALVILAKFSAGDLNAELGAEFLENRIVGEILEPKVELIELGWSEFLEFFGEGVFTHKSRDWRLVVSGVRKSKVEKM